MIGRITLACACLVACTTTSSRTTAIGAVCDLGTAPDPGELVIESSVADCSGGACLKLPLENPTPPKGFSDPGPSRGLCTARCQVDSDCAADGACLSGFTCGVPSQLTVGPLCCEKLCICKDYVVVAGSGLPTPAACDPANPSNACCNLPGRTGNASYPSCPAH